MSDISLLEKSKLQIMSLKTRFRYFVLVNLQRSYPENVDVSETIFIHVPKTAGTSFHNLIGYTGIGHVTYKWYESRDPEKFQKYFKFAFVRNPWDRLVSAFFYLKKGGSNAMDRQWFNANLSHYENFKDFVYNWVNEENIECYFHFMPQHKFIYDDSLTLKVDYIGRFENIREDFTIIANKIGLQQNLPYVNKSQRKAYQSYYSDEMKEIVRQAYHQDIELFQYTFD